MSAPIYDIYKEFSEHLSDVSSTSPGWIIAIYRLAYPISYDRTSGQSIDKYPGQGAELRGKNPLIIASDCTSITVSSSKSSHVHSMNATLRLNSNRNYLVEILPGDWVMAWMFDDVEKVKDVGKRLIEGKEPTNRFSDGLKFVGRVDSIFKQLQTSPSGVKRVEYSLNALAFGELNTSIVYFHDLAEQAFQQITTWMAKIGLDLKDLFVKQSNGSVEDNVDKIITGMFEILLGKGAKKGVAGISPGQSEGLGSGAGGGIEQPVQYGPVSKEEEEASKAAPFAYIVPEIVGKTLNKVSRNGKGVLAYADLIEMLVGRQEYKNAESSVEARFQPEIKEIKGNVRHTGNKLIGVFLPMPMSFVNKPLWAVVSQFVNPTVNEMFTTLRVNEDGHVVPTVVLRQYPFTTDAMPDSLLTGGYGATRYTEIPRWIIDPRMVTDFKIGRSNATRVNLVHVGVLNNLHIGVGMSQQFATDPPIMDPLDIQRSGVFPYMTTIATDTFSATNRVPTTIMRLVADRLMNSHLTMNGTIKTIGIQAPIALGDNIQFQGTVLHIETITHSASIDGTGKKRFETSLGLTNGLKSPDKNGFFDNNPDDDGQGNSFTASNDYKIYQGVSNDSNIEDDPGVSNLDQFDFTIKDE